MNWTKGTYHGDMIQNKGGKNVMGEKGGVTIFKGMSLGMHLVK